MDARVDRVEGQLGLGRRQGVHQEHQQPQRRQRDAADADDAEDEQPDAVRRLGSAGLDPEGAPVGVDLGDGLVLAADLVERAPGGGVADQLPVKEVERSVCDPAHFGVEAVTQQGASQGLGCANTHSALQTRRDGKQHYYTM